MDQKSVVLIANYLPDKQESMERFASLLKTGFEQASIKVTIWRPKRIFAPRFSNTSKGVAKWLGYIDKWVIFPMIIFSKCRFNSWRYKNFHFHVCDHSNAPYLNYLPKKRSSITCHDVLAIRGAFGYEDAYCPASVFGKILQKWIFRHLRRTRKVACVSQLTYNQLISLVDNSELSGWQVIHNSMNDNFHKMSDEESKRLIAQSGFKWTEPYILHVGSNLPRKNRKVLIDMLNIMGSGWKGNVCFAGQQIDSKLRLYIEELNLQHRVFDVLKPSNEILISLYNRCDAFVFPSFSEGFGWPVIEAQMCGAPVIASNIEPMPEIGGNGVLYANPHIADDFVAAFYTLKNLESKNQLISSGFENTKRFNKQDMIAKYVSLIFYS